MSILRKLAEFIGDTPDTIILLAVTALGGILAGAGWLALNSIPVEGVDTFFRWAPLVMLAISFVHYIKFTAPSLLINCRSFNTAEAVMVSSPALLIIAVNCWVFSLLGAEHPGWTGFFLISQIGGLPFTWAASRRMLTWHTLNAIGSEK